jgi:tetratricopeptide (TPR) repeat protein
MCSGASPDIAAGRYLSPYHLAGVYTGLGEYDQAMDCLERARDERADRRSQALLRKMNLA